MEYRRDQQPVFFLRSLSFFLSHPYSFLTSFPPSHRLPPIETGPVASRRASSGTGGGNGSTRRRSARGERCVAPSPPHRHLDGEAPPRFVRVDAAQLLRLGTRLRLVARQGRRFAFVPRGRRGSCGRGWRRRRCFLCCCYCAVEFLFVFFFRRCRRRRRGQRKRRRRGDSNRRRGHLQGHQRRREPGGAAPGQAL